jgi:hypothetical protein
MEGNLALDALSVYVQHAHVSKGLFLEEVATLCCTSSTIYYVSKQMTENTDVLCDCAINTILSFIADENKDDVLEILVNKRHTIDIVRLAKTVSIASRLYCGGEDKEKQLAAFMMDFSKNASLCVGGANTKDYWKEVNKDIQYGTLSILWYLRYYDEKVIYLVANYTLYSFLKMLAKKVVVNKKLSIMASKSVRFEVISQAVSVTANIRATIFKVPHGFIERLIRLLGDVRRTVSKL